jgi:hypothetical protein
MIQLSDFYETAINPLQIVYFNIIKDPAIAGRIKCTFNNNYEITLNYDSPEALKNDYNKLLKSSND